MRSCSSTRWVMVLACLAALVSACGDDDAPARDAGRDAAPPDGGDADATALAAGLRMLREVDLRAELPQIAQPALIVHGVNDALGPQAAGEYMARLLPHAEFESMAGVGHAPFVTREAQVAKWIREFDGRH